MRVAAIIQARMGSTRLPGKTLAMAAGKPLLVHMIERLKRCETLNDVVVAYPLADDAVLHPVVCGAEARPFVGPEDDVLKRVLLAARGWQVDVIVELTADCPLIDPKIVDEAVRRWESGQSRDRDFAHNLDFVSSSRDSLHPRNVRHAYPRGMDVRVFSTSVLAEVDRLTQDPRDREHVSLYIWEHQHRFWCHDLIAPENLRDDVRLTVDTPEDLELVRTIFEELYPADREFGLGHILKLLKAAPELREINVHVDQKEVR